LGAIGAAVRTAGLATSTGIPEITDPAVGNIELGDEPILAEDASQGFSSGFQQVSQGGLSSRTGAQTTIEDTPGEIEMSDFTPETTPYDIFPEAPPGQLVGEINIDPEGVLTETAYDTPEILGAGEIGAGEIVPATAAEVAGMSSFEIGGEAVAAGAAETVAAGVGAGLLAGAAAVATAGAATVGALGYFASQGLFDWQKQEDAYQKGAYDTAQAVATLTPPKLMYVPPNFNGDDPNSVMAYLNRKQQAQDAYQQALSDYNTALAAKRSGATPTAVPGVPPPALAAAPSAYQEKVSETTGAPPV